MQIITISGEQLPITRMADANGEETHNRDEAVACVAGPDRNGNWHAVRL